MSCATCAPTSAAEAGARQTYEALIKACDDEGTKKALTHLLTREITHANMFMKALDAMGKLTDPMFGNVPPDDTVKLVFNLSQGEDVRGPWNEEPEFEYIADPEPKGGMPPAPVNPSDERSAEAKPKVKVAQGGLTRARPIISADYDMVDLTGVRSMDNTLATPILQTLRTEQRPPPVLLRATPRPKWRDWPARLLRWRNTPMARPETKRGKLRPSSPNPLRSSPYRTFDRWIYLRRRRLSAGTALTF